MTVDMSVELCEKKLRNPVIAASGTFAFGRQHSWFIDVNKLGGIALKSLTPEKRTGNRPPRIAETPSGIINSVGLQNPGVDAFLDKTLKYVETLDTAVIANVAGRSIEDYVYVIDRLNDTRIDFFELNISCPNVSMGGASIGTDEAMTYECVKKAKSASRKPVIAKLTVSAGNVVRIAKAAEDAGAEALSLINTLPAMAVDVKTKKPILGNITGGLSGPCIKPVALKTVYDVSISVNIPVIGIGGIMTGEDAAEFMLCGAAAVMTGTANLIDPKASVRIIEELESYAVSMNIEKISALTGALEV
jgi:dihydroorotate dehydrogenase (NAD+) catalytic subunit